MVDHCGHETRLLKRPALCGQEAAVSRPLPSLGVTLVARSASDRHPGMRAACTPLYETLHHRFHDPRQQALLDTAVKRSGY